MKKKSLKTFPLFKLIFFLSLFAILGYFLFQRKSWIVEKKKEYHQEMQKLRFKERKKKKTLADIYYLAQKHHQGIPEIFTKEGKKLNGLKPNFHKAVSYYGQLIGTSYHYHALVPLADIHHYGYMDETTFINYPLAREYYSQALKSPVRSIRLEAMEKLQQLNSEQHLPMFQNMEESESHFQEIIQPEPQPLPNIPQPVSLKDTIRNDTQNVHDSGVVNSVKETIRKLQTEISLEKDIPTCCREINEFLKEKDGALTERAQKTFDVICARDTFIASAGVSELELLGLVWNKTQTLKASERENMKESLITQLAEAQEHGETVCAQGRFNHVLASLDVISSQPTVLPLWAIKQEMFNKASKMRNEYPDLSGSEFKYRLKAEFKADYSRRGIVSEKFIDSEVDSWELD